jgi:Holliday junction resolvase RusA-like endonuclease
MNNTAGLSLKISEPPEVARTIRAMITEPIGIFKAPTHFEMKIDLSRIVLKVCIPGEPQAWERAGRNGSRSFDTPANKAAKLTIRQYVMLANPRLKPDCQNRFGKIFLFATHKWNTDEDNYAKLVNDAVKGLVWKDDRQADESYVRVARGPNVIPQTQLIFYTLPLDLGGL